MGTDITQPVLRTDGLTATREPPGPRLPVLVQTAMFGVFRQYWLPRLRRRYGDMVRLHIYPERSVVVLADVEHVRAVFAGPASVFHAGEGNVVLEPAMGEHSVLLTDEEEHLRARKLLMPAFNGASLRGYREMITELAEAEARRWPANRAFSSHARMQALTLEVILRVVFGVAEGPRLDELRHLLRRVVDVGPVELIGWHNPRLRNMRPWRSYTLAQRRVDRLLYAEIAERRHATDLDRRRDVLSRLLGVSTGMGEQALTDAELRDQLVTLLLAGHETTATALAWALHELARDPVELEKATRAADAGDEKYLEAVVKEAMRLHPVVPEVARRLTRDVQLGEVRIPAGHTVMPSISLIHADVGHHPAPRRFRPERFLGSGPAGPAAGTWFPFGGGVRRCLGAGFSLLESVVMLRAVLTRHHVTTDRRRPERARAHHVTMVPARGARIVTIPRQ